LSESDIEGRMAMTGRPQVAVVMAGLDPAIHVFLAD
jgi:hypothetical protein